MPISDDSHFTYRVEMEREGGGSKKMRVVQKKIKPVSGEVVGVTVLERSLSIPEAREACKKHRANL